MGFNQALFYTEQEFLNNGGSGVFFLENKEECKTFRILRCAIKDNKGFRSNIISRRTEMRTLS